MRSTCCLVAVSAVAFCVPTGLMADEPPWPTALYDYIVVNQDLRIVLQQFGSNTGLRVALSDAVQGRVRGRLPSALPREFLDHLAQAFGLDWYYDGALISISAASEAQTRLLPLQGAQFQKLRNSLSIAGLLDPHYQLRPEDDPSIVVVSGPPRYVAMVQQTVSALSSESAPKPAVPAKDTLVVFRGSSVSRLEFP
jgi:type III secretion protein C